MEKIFISYSRIDTDAVNQLVSKLEEVGYDVWIDREGIQGGEKWRSEIVKAIESSDIFMLILSPNSIKSQNVLKELDLAELKKIRIIPVILHPVSIPHAMEYQMVGLQRIDLSENFDAGFMRLVTAFKPRVSEPESKVQFTPQGLHHLVHNICDSYIKTTSSERKSGIIIGALGWCVGGALGGMLMGMSSDLFLPHRGLLWGAIIGLIDGTLFGSIAKKFYMSSISIFLFALIGAVFLGLLGLSSIFLYNEDLLGISTVGLMASSAIGGAIGWSLLKVILISMTTKRLKKRGKSIVTHFKGVEENTFVVVNGRHPYQIVTEWRNPDTNKIHLFYSKELWFDPSIYIDINKITVFVDENNLNTYYMDLSFLPVRG